MENDDVEVLDLGRFDGSIDFRLPRFKGKRVVYTDKDGHVWTWEPENTDGSFGGFSIKLMPGWTIENDNDTVPKGKKRIRLVPPKLVGN